MMWSAGVGYILQGSKEEWDLNSVEVGIIGTCFPLGLMIGAFVWGVIGDRYGRMYSFKSTVVLSTICSLCLLFSFNYLMVGGFLLLLGAGMGGELSLGGTVFCEFCPPSKLYYLTVMAIFWGAGGTYVALAAFLTSLTNTTSISNWRFIVASGCLIEIGCLVFRFSLQETPAYCLEKGQIEKAEKVLNEISMENTSKSFLFGGLLKDPKKQTITNRNELKPHIPPHILIAKLFKGENLKVTLVLGLVIII